MSDDSSDDERERQQPKLVDDNAGLHPLFWDALPENAEEDPAYTALKAIDDELTPDQKAENFKSQGNNKLKLALSDKADTAARRTLLREAVQCYGDGLAVTGLQEHQNLVATLHCNRAQAHLLLGNWRKALEDGLAAQAIEPKNVKAIFRAARGASKLGLWERCLALCEQGRAADPASKEFDALAKESSAKLAEARTAAEREAAKREAAAAPARRLVEALTQRGIQLTRPQVSLGHRNKPQLEEDGRLTWPVLLMYAENMQQDVVEAFGEEDTFAEHLDLMFGPEAPPLEWDTAREYTRDRVELYYLAHAGKPLRKDQLVEAMQGRWPPGVVDGSELGPQRYGSRAARMRRVNPKHTLKQVLAAEDHVVAGIPLFWVVAKGTAYRERFLDDAAK